MANKFKINEDVTIKIVETKKETLEMIAIRYDTFTKKMNIPFEDEFDGSDINAVNFILYYKEKAVGTIRYVKEDNKYRLGRFAVLSEYRKLGLGRILFTFVENYISTTFAPCTIYFHGMAYLKGFYLDLGFKTTTDIFLEEGIEHIGFEKEIN